jgi:hypothetical protein
MLVKGHSIHTAQAKAEGLKKGRAEKIKGMGWQTFLNRIQNISDLEENLSTRSKNQLNMRYERMQ